MKTIEGQQFITIIPNDKEVYKIDYGKAIPTLDIYNSSASGTYISIKDELPDLGDEVNDFFIKEISSYFKVPCESYIQNVRLPSSCLYIWSEFGGEISILRH